MQCLFFGAVISLAGITSPAADRSVVTNAVARPPQAVKPGESFGTDKSDAEKQAALQRIVRERCEIRRNMLNGPNPQIAKAQVPNAISNLNRWENEILGVVPRLRIGCHEAIIAS